MNKERLEALASHIEKLAPHHCDADAGEGCFTMSTYFYSCGSPACIAGHCVALFEPELFTKTVIENPVDNSIVLHQAKNLLGLSFGTAQRLFRMVGTQRTYLEITPTGAAKVLRHLARTGNVNWGLG